MSGRVVHKAYFSGSGGFQMGGGAEAPAAAAPAAVRRPPRPRLGGAPVVRTFGTRTESLDKAAALLQRMKAPMRDLLQKARLGQAVEESVVGPIVSEIAGSIESHPTALITLARLKAASEYAHMHALAVCALMINFGRQLELDQGAMKDLGVAGLLHDIGETSLPAVLLERSATLTPPEMALVRTHTQRGHEHLERIAGLPAVALDVCLNHHERVDARGYPGGKGAAQLSLEAKMGAICDVYDAVTSHRPHREAFSPPEGLADMFDSTGQFDPSLLAHFIRSVGIYPAGSLVRLESDHLAIVLEQSAEDLTKPLVRIFYSILDRGRVPHRDVALTDGSDLIVDREEPRKWGFLDWDRQWPQLLRTP